MYEVEVKAHVRDRSSTLKTLENLGFKFGEVLHQVDHIFIPEGASFPPPFKTPVLRVREQGSKFLFTLKISQSGRQDCIERELEVSDGTKMIEIMKLINYKEVAVVDKKRIRAKLDDMEVVFDEVKDLGEFMEVEKIVMHENPEDRKFIQEELCTFLESVGVSKEQHLVNHKYDIMIFEKLNLK